MATIGSAFLPYWIDTVSHILFVQQICRIDPKKYNRAATTTNLALKKSNKQESN